MAWAKMGNNPVTKEFPISLLSLVTLLEIVQNLKKKVKTDLPCSFFAKSMRFLCLKSITGTEILVRKIPVSSLSSGSCYSDVAQE